VPCSKDMSRYFRTVSLTRRIPSRRRPLSRRFFDARRRPGSATPSPATRSRAATRELWLDRLALSDFGLTPAPFCASEVVSSSTVNQDSHLQWPRRRLRSMISAEALARAASLLFADNKVGPKSPAGSNRVVGPWPTSGSTPSRLRTARACYPARLTWGTDDTTGRGKTPTCRGLAGPKSGPSRPQVGPQKTTYLPIPPSLSLRSPRNRAQTRSRTTRRSTHRTG
jgi:hypothetical protein